MRPDDLVGYSYRADNYCEVCVFVELTGGKFPDLKAERVLNELAAPRGIDRDREATFDSGEFPKVILRDQAREGGGEGDPSTCGLCGDDLATVPAIPWREAADERATANDASVSRGTEDR